MKNVKIFGLNGSKQFAQKVAKELDISLATHIERNFGDSETYVRSSENVRGKDVFIIHSLYSDFYQSVGEKFTTLLFFIGSLKDASAKTVTVVCPYLGYSRQDRKTESRAPITTKYIAKFLESAGCDRLITMDVHNLAAFQNAFRIPVDNLECKNLMADFLLNSKKCPDELVILSPDTGGMNRVRRFRDAILNKKEINISLAYLDKERISDDEIRGDQIIGVVEGKDVIILDDMISSGKTIKRASQTIKKFKGKVWGVFATHGLFVGNSEDYLSGLKRVIIANTVPPIRYTGKNLHNISTESLFARVIRRTMNGDSISELL